MNWLDKLDAESRELVLDLQFKRATALYIAIELGGSMAEARKIVAKCNKAIQEIAEGVAVC